MTMPASTMMDNRGVALQRAGGNILRYSLALILVWLGGLKFAMYEAEGIKPLIEHSPLIGWMYSVFSVSGAARCIGVIEIILGIMILSRVVAPMVSALGSFGAVCMSLVTLSFLLTTPGVWQMGMSFPFLSGDPGAFLVKDLLLLGAAVWSTGEALSAARMMASPSRL